jgi:phage head maturation protease
MSTILRTGGVAAGPEPGTVITIGGESFRTPDEAPTIPFEAPRDNLFRGLAGSPVELRAEDDDAVGSTLFGHFARFDSWNEIDSWYEGRFLERIAKGAFRKTMREQRDRIRCQFDHGYDSFVGSAPLGHITVLREEAEGPYYEVELLDTDYIRERILPLLQGRTLDGRMLGSLLGASYRFRVTKETWVEPKKATDWNPDLLPERTIQESTVMELGPVPFPADFLATAGVRSVSLTDHFIARQAQRTGQTERAARQLAPHRIAGAAASGTPTEPPVEVIDGPPNEPPSLALGGISLARLRALRVSTI